MESCVDHLFLGKNERCRSDRGKYHKTADRLCEDQSSGYSSAVSDRWEFGIAEAILESLVQSHSGYLEFLPALPKTWQCGEVKGVLLRGGIIADFSWEEGRITDVR